jgi:hypothetical protein
MSAQHAVSVRTGTTVGPADALRGFISWPGQDHGLFADQKHGVQAAPGR